MRCIVIGAGIIGTCTALRLVQQGAQVTLIEASLPGDGTTGTSFAWVNAGGKYPREYFELNVAGMMAYRRLMAEWPGAPWFVPTGNLQWETTSEAQERLVKHTEDVVCRINWFLPTLSEARLIAMVGVIHRSTERKRLL